jgi:acetyl-CoA acetyltransferase
MAARQPFSRKAAIAGIGYTAFSRESGRTVLELAMEAVTKAIADAGLERQAVDGLISYHMGDSVPVTTVARTLGLSCLAWHNDIAGGGSQCASILGDAAMAVAEGLAETVVVYRALNGRSGKRMGQIGLGSGDDHEADFLTPFGFRGPVNLMALVAQPYVAERGLTEHDMAALAVQQRAKAVENPKALLRTPLTKQDYLDAPMIASPLRRLDCCLETDAACALVVTSAERARALRHRPVLIHAAVRGGAPGCSAMDKAGTHPTRIFSETVGPMIFDAAGMKPADIDLLQLYDGYSYLLLRQLEDFGYCRPGEVKDVIHGGRLGRTGDLPTNMNGGLLSEGYVHGLNNVVEAVEQLQGRAGARQVTDATTALVSGFGGSYGSAAILAAE